ncbi:hypothetical protein ZIOFF_006082 [Zingiber officinale]|uniref:Protein kinase domain-containing protein n=1 Tax=Zingiber officinale TaxID=94328 RepID=A0A8J5M4U0_ZINOF|nr:hypothetical protein ZIOFF_006082 [Zingiber officinale]
MASKPRLRVRRMHRAFWPQKGYFYYSFLLFHHPGKDLFFDANRIGAGGFDLPRKLRFEVSSLGCGVRPSGYADSNAGKYSFFRNVSLRRTQGWKLLQIKASERIIPQRKRLQKPSIASSQRDSGKGNIAAQTFTFEELVLATKNFLAECLLGEGGFGRVYKGSLQNSGQIVAVKQLKRDGFQGNKEFVVEVLMLSLLHHQNLVKLIGYCANGDQRLLVYEFMPMGSLEDHLLDISSNHQVLSWYTRMKIAYGTAQGLEYLHEKANPPVIFRDLKSANILLDQDFNAKLSDFGLAKLGPVEDKVYVSSRVMGTIGYCAPEYARTGHLSLKSDVYSFGVVLLELITGRRAIDSTRPTNEQNLVSWARPMLGDQKRFLELVDQLIQGNYPPKGLSQAVAVAAMCLQEETSVRPSMADVVISLSFLTAPSGRHEVDPAPSSPS